MKGFLGLALATPSLAGTLLWDGRCNNHSTSAFLNNWSFSSPVGEYQYYIHGDGPVEQYVNLGTAYKNPADRKSKQGIQISIDKTSHWHNQTFLRTELIPQTSAPINSSKVFYHFSMQINAQNPPSPYHEHQINFFENHFTEMKYGLLPGESGTSDTRLQWMVNKQSKWSTPLVPGVWHNVAYEIDFDAQTVGFHHSTGADALQSIVKPMPVLAQSDRQDWHLGVLRLPLSNGENDDSPEAWHFSGVYIEEGSLTTKV